MKKQLKYVVYVIIFVSVLTSLTIGYRRAKIENAHKQYDIAVKYTDVLNISMQTGMSYEHVLKELKENGVNILFVTENKIICDDAENLGSYNAQGKATYFTGYDLALSTTYNKDIHTQYSYVWCTDECTKENIYNYFTQKGYIVNEVNVNGQTYLELPYTKALLTAVGVGFNNEDMQIAAQIGYTICPQLFSLTTDGTQGIEYMVQRISELPNLGPIFFNDSSVACYDMDVMKELLQIHGAGFVEFHSNKQKGFTKLVENASNHLTDFNMYRLHTLSDGEVDKYDQAALNDRFELALTERGMSLFLFKLPRKYMPMENYQALKERVSSFRELANKDGYTQGNLSALNFPKINYVKALLSSIAAIGVFILLCIELKQEKVGIILGIVGFIGYAALLKLSLKWGTQLMAIFINVIFPTYAMYKGLKFKDKNLIQVMMGVGVIFGISVIGAISFVGIMSRTEYALGIELFRGVKIVFVLPILLVGILLMNQEKLLRVNVLEKWIKLPITYFVAVITAMFMIIFAIYIIRSGNSPTVSETQLQIRQVLKDVFGTRPRTKEFLIGYPIIMCLIYFGKHKLYIPMSLLATVGPISIVNTFTHIHTPLLISIKRTLWGLLLGIVVGLILIQVIKWCLSIFNKRYMNYKESTKS